jgi:hypothetical protein
MLQHNALVGVWLVFGATWTDRGDAGESTLPPYAGEVLTALTEAVWWDRLEVAPREHDGKADTWTPLVVLEWPPPLTARASIPVPGEPTAERVQPPPVHLEDGDEGGAWLDDKLPELQDFDDDQLEVHTVQARPTGLPERRSAITVLRGELRADGGRHRGRYALVPMNGGPEGGLAATTPLSTWLAAARDQPAPAVGGEHRLGPPLELPGGGIGFPVLGWLDRRLRLRPRRWEDVQPGLLHDRDVGGLLWARLLESGRVSAALFLAVLLVALLVWKASEPQARSFHAPPAPEPPPALSLCSVDNQRFIQELRCQVAAMAVAENGMAPVCGDELAEDGSPPTFDGGDVPEDVQPLWCGLRDRELDDRFSPELKARWADLAAARACFNVLGYPETYALAPDSTAPARPDVTAFFDERKLRIQPLVRLVADLDASCEEVGRRARRQVEGAVLATHVGDPTGRPDPATGLSPGSASEAGRLREHLGSIAGRSLSIVERRCLQHGLRAGVEDAFQYDDLCGPDVPPPPASPAWLALGPRRPIRAPEPPGPGESGTPEPPPPPSVFDRYVAARFSLDQQSSPVSLARAVGKADSTWRCHVAFVDERLAVEQPARRTSVNRVWDLALPVPRRYDLRGSVAVRDQLLLDAGIKWLRERGSGGVCWEVVLGRLGDYTPVHPLLPERGEGPWPSAQQQLCGQVCAAWYRVARAPRASEWITPNYDLARCVDGRDLAVAPPPGDAGLDALRLPWNSDREAAWTRPSPAEICAFNLLAQGWLEDGPVPLPVDGSAPQRWAGESEPGSQIAGGVADLAVQGALALDSYGGERSAATCGYVAAQCVTTQLLDAMATYPERPFTWAPTLQQRLSDLANGREGPRATPWCRLVKPYLPREDTRADGRLDYPCATAVADTAGAGMALVERLAAGGAGVEPEGGAP